MARIEVRLHSLKAGVLVDESGREYERKEAREVGWIDHGPAALMAISAFFLSVSFLEDRHSFGWVLMALAPIFWMGRKRFVVDSCLLAAGTSRKTDADRENEARQRREVEKSRTG